MSKTGWFRETIINEQTQEKSFVYKHPETPFAILSRQDMRKWWFYGYKNELHIFDSFLEAKQMAFGIVSEDVE